LARESTGTVDSTAAPVSVRERRRALDAGVQRLAQYRRADPQHEPEHERQAGVAHRRRRTPGLAASAGPAMTSYPYGGNVAAGRRLERLHQRDELLRSPWLRPQGPGPVAVGHGGLEQDEWSGIGVGGDGLLHLIGRATHRVVVDDRLGEPVTRQQIGIRLDALLRKRLPW
jgi:hypothetical protein